jgi:hypothetical protein
MSNDVHNRYEKNYLENYDIRYELMQKMRQELPRKHTCSREFPSMESKQMFDRFNGSTYIKKEIDISEINAKCNGNFIKHLMLSEYNKMTISGPAELVSKFVNQDPSERKINIFVNAVKPIPGTNKLWDKDFVLENELTEASTSEYKYYEQPFSQQYCNYYEFFEKQYGINYDYSNHFIVIITIAKTYDMYREVYPHYLICTQPIVNISGVGYTRNSALTLGYYLQLDRMINVDDNVVDLFICTTTDPNSNDVGCYKVLSDLSIIEKLFKDNFMDNIALVGFNKGTPLSDSTYDLYMKENNYIKDDILKISSDSDIIFRTYTPKLIDPAHSTNLVTTNQSVPNPHRPKILLMNVRLLWKHHLNYNISMRIGEDIHFTRVVYLNKLNIGLLNIAYIDPYDERRPKLEIFHTTKPEPADDNRFMNKSEIQSLHNSYFVETLADLIMLYGKIIYFNPEGIYVGLAVYGPYRLVTKEDYKIIQTSLDPKYNINDIVKSAFVDEKRIFEVSYVRPNQFEFNLPNHSLDWRKKHVREYIKDNIISIPDNVIKAFNEKFTAYYDLATYKSGIVYKTCGMPKYLLQYEYLDKMMFKSFAQMCKKKIFVNFILTLFKKITTMYETNKLDLKFLIVDNLFYYLRNVQVDPPNIHRMCTLLILFIRFERYKHIIKHKKQLTKTEFEKLIMIFGGSKCIYFEGYQINELIDQFLIDLLEHTRINEAINTIEIDYMQIKNNINKVYQKILGI